MYERSAIVLERYFENILGYMSEYNLRSNYKEYCDLLEKLDKLQNDNLQEQTAIQEFNIADENIKSIQKMQERLYKKSAKLEYNRNLLFNNIDGKTDEIEKCIIKIESDVDKINDSLKDLREKLIEAIQNFKQKKSVLTKSKKAAKISNERYLEALENTKLTIENMNEISIEFAKDFISEEIKEKLVQIMMNNGKNEKIPFDKNVIESVADIGLDVAQREVECYLEIFDRTLKLLNEIEKDTVNIQRHQKKLKHIKIKLNFLMAEKEYLVQLLDYERMSIISGKKKHQKLMEEACENLKIDIVQINNLYELILREIANKSTKKGYKELYNKTYLISMKEKEEAYRKEKYKMSSNTGTVLDANYWRIEGIKNIYTVFYHDISEGFGRDIEEFDLPDEQEEISEENRNIAESLPLEDITKQTKAEDLSEKILPEENEDLMFEAASSTEEFDIFGEKYHLLEDEEVLQTVQETVKEEAEQNIEENTSQDLFKTLDEEDIPYEPDELAYEQEEEEESLFSEN